ncbi:anthranilate synthase component I family protein [Myxococcota bacterium]|nr:anthranilate synthase component I family protein [Myxococcota bacterium]
MPARSSPDTRVADLAGAPLPLPPPAGGLDGLLHAAARAPDLDGLACLDLGERWTVLTWAGAGVTGGRDGDLLRWSVEDGGSWLVGARALGRSGPTTGLPLPAGVVGWLGYEAGAACERMPAPRAPRPLPDVALWRVEGSVAWDRRADRWWLQGSAGFRDRARALLAEVCPPPPPPPVRPAPPPPPPGAAQAYQDAVRAALAEITRGQVYQVNLAWELVGAPTPDPVGAWLALRRANPARQGALLRLGPHTVLSNSPERYLRLRPTPAGLHVASVPIKGTAPRSSGAEGRRHLAASDKERAELTMIVDLVRNDLGRVARAGGVRWGARRLRTCGDLLHAEQSVRALLRPEHDAWAAVAASFPPGSVTGAPKVAAMELIGALEAGPRGVYTGSLVALGDDGHGWLNVAIRTATLSGGLARLHVGAGIVADSDPQAEWRETLAKAAALSRHVLAIDADPRSDA